MVNPSLGLQKHHDLASPGWCATAHMESSNARSRSRKTQRRSHACFHFVLPPEADRSMWITAAYMYSCYVVPSSERAHPILKLGTSTEERRARVRLRRGNTSGSAPTTLDIARAQAMARKPPRSSSGVAPCALPTWKFRVSGAERYSSRAASAAARRRPISPTPRS